MGVAGGIIAAGVVLKAVAAKREAKTAEAIAKFNAAAKVRKAERAREVGAEEQLRLRTEMRRTLSRNRVATAVAGVQPIGSPFEAQLEVIRDFSGDISETGRNAQIAALGFETEADLFREQGKEARRAGKLAVASAIIGGVSDLATLNAKQKLAEK